VGKQREGVGGQRREQAVVPMALDSWFGQNDLLFARRAKVDGARSG
jgi:hypothetical protein